MSIIKLMHAKLHRVTVTEAKRDYVGSVTIDFRLARKGRNVTFRRSRNRQCQ
jgi:aspartate 1-decarboxylase